MPHEHRPAGRLAKTTPLYPVLKEQGAEFGVVAGWERALFFKPSLDFVDEHSFRFTPTKDVVAAEVANIRDNVGLMEVSGFNRYEISGPGVAEWLDSLTCSRIPSKVGKVGLCYFLTEKGHVLREATIAKLGEERFWYGSAAAAEYHDWDFLTDHLPDAGVVLTPMTRSHTILAVAGPKSRALLQAVAPRDDWTAEAFPWLSVRQVHLGFVPAVAMSVFFSGELAWELHIPNEHLYLAHQTLCAAGAAFGLKGFGLYATESMRLEKGYLQWRADLITERTPFETGLDRFVRMNKPDFPGKAALEQARLDGPEKRLAAMIVDHDAAPAHGGDSVYAEGRLVGTVTSAGWGHRVGANIAYAFVDAGLAVAGAALDVEIIGKRYSAKVVSMPLYDPDTTLPRS
jgi:dimethylglycine dehydrogenase